MMVLLIAALSILSFLIVPSTVGSEVFPARNVRLLTTVPGSSTDNLARIIAPELSNALGESVIVDNRANRLLGRQAAQATPDGHTLIVGGSSFQFAPLIQEHGYDPIKSFSAISQLDRAPNVLVANAALPVNTVKELIALANSRPGELGYGSAGAGGTPHLAAEMLRTLTGIDIVPVPYRSTSPAVRGLLGEEVQLVFSTPATALPHLKSGKLKALAVTSPQATPLVPGVPTMASQGLPGFELENMGFVLAPVGTPAAAIRRLNREIVTLMAKPQVKEQLLTAGSEAFSSSPEDLATKMQFDDDKMRKLLAGIGVTARK